MEKIFDIAKDSEQSWGTLATAIDENNNILSDKINELGVFEDIEYQEDILTNKTLSPGYYLYTTGIVNSEYQYHSELIDVKAGDIINYSLKSSNSTFAAVIAAFKNSTYSKDDSIQDQQNGSGYINQGSYIVPEGVTSIGISSASLTGNVVTKTMYKNSLQKLSNQITYTHIKINRKDNAKADFTGLNAIKEALDSITDNSYYNRYILDIEGHFIFTDTTYHTKFINEKDSENSWITNVYGKDYVTLDGGNNKDTSIEVYFDENTQFPDWSNGNGKYYGANYHVIFNNAEYFECKNIAFIGKNTRYCLHMENFSENTDSFVQFENCNFSFEYTGLNQGHSLNGDTVIGCGYRANVISNFFQCKIVALGNRTNTVLFGLHGGYPRQYLKIINPATIVFENCIFSNPYGFRFVKYDTYYNVSDSIIFNHCNVLQDLNMEYSVLPYGDYMYPFSFPDVKYSGRPLAVYSSQNAQSKVLRVKCSTGNSSQIRLDTTSTAYDLISDIIVRDNPTITDFGGYYLNGYIYKDDLYSYHGYLIGTRDVGITGMGKILGDCSLNSKSLKIILNDSPIEVIFDTDLTENSNDSILSLINEQLSAYGLICDMVYSGEYYYPQFDCVKFIRNDGDYADGGMIVSIIGNTFKKAKDGDKVVGVLIDDTPKGEFGRVAYKGVFSCKTYEYNKSLGGILISSTSFSPGSYYKIGAENGILIKSASYEGAVVLGLSYDKALLLNI